MHKSENSDLTFLKLNHTKGMVSSNLVNVISSFKLISFKIQDFATNCVPTYTRMSATNGGRTKFLGEVDSEMKAGQVKWQPRNSSTFWQQDIEMKRHYFLNQNYHPFVEQSTYYFVSNIVVKCLVISELPIQFNHAFSNLHLIFIDNCTYCLGKS